MRLMPLNMSGAPTEASSAKKLKRLINDKVLTPSEAGRVQNVVVVECDDTILTVYHKTKKLRRH